MFDKSDFVFKFEVLILDKVVDDFSRVVWRSVINECHFIVSIVDFIHELEVLLELILRRQVSAKTENAHPNFVLF